MKTTLPNNHHPMKKSRIPKSSLAALLLLAALPQLAHAATGTWNVDANGLWSLNTNWLSDIIADGSGFTANFTNDITADRTVSLDSARTLTSLVFSDSATATPGSWILDNNATPANTLTGISTITVNALGTGATANISAVIAGTGTAITKSGTGTLVLSGANTFTKTDSNNTTFAMRLTQGTVVIASDSAFGVTTGTGFNATTLINLNGATLQASGSARTVANPIWLNTASITVSGDQSITFSGTVSGRSTNPTLTNNITGAGTLSLTNNVYTDNLSGVKTVTFGGTGNTLISGVIANNTTGAAGNGNITKSGAGTLTLSNTASTYTGVTTINAGVMEAAALTNGGTNSSIGKSTNAASNLVFGAPTATLRYNGSSDVTIDRGFTLSSGTGGGATIESSGSGTLTIDNTVALAYGTTGQTRLLTLGGTNTGANTFSKVIADNGSGATSLTKDGTGQWVLGGANTYTGNTTVSAGTLTLDTAGTLKFVPTANGVCNKITGAGTATLNGTFNIDLTNAAIANGNSWTLVDTTIKNGTLAAVTGFTGSAGVWTKVDGSNTWTYTESTGVLGLVVTSSNFTLTYTAGANGSITGTSPQTVASGGNGTAVTAVPDANYHFVNWSDSSTANPRTDSNVTANVTVTANFAIDTYTDWALANSVAGGVNGDSNNDGVQNGVAYFMGVTGQTTNPGLNASNQVTWPVNPNYQGTFEVQISSDLIIWTPASPQPTPSAGNLTYTLPSGLGKQFVRLVVTPN